MQMWGDHVIRTIDINGKLPPKHAKKEVNRYPKLFNCKNQIKSLSRVSFQFSRPPGFIFLGQESNNFLNNRCIPQKITFSAENPISLPPTVTHFSIDSPWRNIPGNSRDSVVAVVDDLAPVADTAVTAGSSEHSAAVTLDHLNRPDH